MFVTGHPPHNLTNSFVGHTQGKIESLWFDSWVSSRVALLQFMAGLDVNSSSPDGNSPAMVLSSIEKEMEVDMRTR